MTKLLEWVALVGALSAFILFFTIVFLNLTRLIHELIYSPTETLEYLRCPAYRLYKRAGWEHSEPWRPHRLLGEAVHAGIAAALNAPSGVDDAVAAVISAGYVETEEWPLARLVKLATGGVSVGLKALCTPGRTLVATELYLPDMRCRVDLVERTAAGLEVTEYKTKLELGAQYVDRELRDHEWQMRHNTWAVSRAMGEPVVNTRLLVIVLTPRARCLPFHEQQYTPGALDHWYRSAVDHWSTMALDVQQGTAPMNLTACWKYGRCPYFEACHTLHGDEAQFGRFYTR